MACVSSDAVGGNATSSVQKKEALQNPQLDHHLLTEMNQLKNSHMKMVTLVRRRIMANLVAGDLSLEWINGTQCVSMFTDDVAAQTVTMSF